MSSINDALKNRALSALLKAGLENKTFTPSLEHIQKWRDKYLLAITENESKNDFELVLVTAEGDLPIVKKYISFYEKNLSPSSIVVVTKKCASTVKMFADTPVQIVDEDSLLPGLTFKKIHSLNAAKAGWYFQQFLKMAYSRYCKNEYYLIIDGDTVPLNKISFLNENKTVFLTKGEHFSPYFNMIKLLFNDEVKKETQFSFIAECMLINKNIMEEMIDNIESNNAIMGNTFYEKILNSVFSDGLNGRDFSEYETYGNYLFHYYEDMCELQRIRSLREAMKFFSNPPESYILDFLSRDFDTVSFERKHIQANPLGLTEYINKCMRGIFPSVGK